MAERYAIVGTAQSWMQTPWDDPDLRILSLNDAYRLKGFRRADEWYDFHPLDKLFFTKGKKIHAHEVPPHVYVRPDGYLDWLSKLSIPLWLNPDHRAQYPASGTWRHARPFPRADIEAYFGRYFGSSPSWMVAHLIMRGVRDISIYGIHLSTEFEYMRQRPNFEFLLGRLLGHGQTTVREADGLRHYETSDGHLALPIESPVLQAAYQYAFEPNPDPHTAQQQWELHKLKVKRQRAIDALKARPWWKPAKALQEELYRVDALTQDVQEQIQRLQMAAQG